MGAPIPYAGGLYDGQVLNSPVEIMRFTLVYDGLLPPQASRESRLEEKQHIRRQLHPQLRELWEARSALRDHWQRYRETPIEQRRQWMTDEQWRAGQLIQPFDYKAFTFVPLVTKGHHMVCELDVLFLRPEPVGRLFAVNQRGDLDNRLKVLFDALRMPNKPNQLPPTDHPKRDEVPFFCLLQDDGLVTALRVESEQLLDMDLPPNHVRLIIRVKVGVQQVSWATIGVVSD